MLSRSVRACLPSLLVPTTVTTTATTATTTTTTTTAYVSSTCANYVTSGCRRPRQRSTDKPDGAGGLQRCSQRTYTSDAHRSSNGGQTRALKATIRGGAAGSTPAAPISFMFPGQGSQFRGMAVDLCEEFPAAAHVLEEVSEATGLSLLRIMRDGKNDELKNTEIAQPAILAHSLAVDAVLRAEYGFSPALSHERHLGIHSVLGHSLGEFSAAVSASSMSLSSAAAVVRKRGQAMAESVAVAGYKADDVAMAALIPFDPAHAKALISHKDVVAVAGICCVANINSPSQTVISGTKARVQAAIAAAKADFGVRRGIALPVSAPFHCALMDHAARVVENELKGVKFADPAVPLVSNVGAAFVTTAEAVRCDLVAQTVAPVLWMESVRQCVAAGVDTFVELGPRATLAGLVRQIDPSVTSLSLSTVEDVRGFPADLFGL